MGRALTGTRQSGRGRTSAKGGNLRVALFGSDTLCRVCLRLLLREQLGDVEVIDMVGAEGAAREAPQGRKVDVAIYSTICPTGVQSTSLKEIMDRLPGVPIAIHTAAADPEILQRFVLEGAAGIISSKASSDVATAALKLVAAGGRYIPPDLLQRPARAPREQLNDVGLRGRFGQLTRREAQVLELIAKGLSNKEVAKQLGLAEATVKIHVRSILKKMKVKNRTQLALLVARLEA
jgi:DNA-binding NarL/FixJ family response regulator